MDRDSIRNDNVMYVSCENIFYDAYSKNMVQLFIVLFLRKIQRVNWIYAIITFMSWKNAITKTKVVKMPL
jgi:hypothetical protein